MVMNLLLIFMYCVILSCGGNIIMLYLPAIAIISLSLSLFSSKWELLFLNRYDLSSHRLNLASQIQPVDW